ncbi:DUF6771 family protein [Rhizorhabdus dicambivorans]|uniref:DUF6771 family protein n=1 Tax=Rhizorhabdus dicambivorans TaxID=1850238 RepID=UPI002F267FFC
MTDFETSQKIAKAVGHAPDWLRQDLSSKDPAVRTRAEETLVAMIAAALKK